MDTSTMSQNELVQQVKSLEFLLRESEENTRKLEAKLKGLVDDKKVLEQGLSDTKNRLEGELNVLSSEKQHFNDRLRDKDTAMKDLSNKFTELAKERDAMICKCDWYQTQLKESTPEHQQSLKRLLNKKFKEVEDLHEELHKIKIQLNGLTLQYKEAELVLVNQSKIIETQFNDLEKKMAEIKALKAATFKQTSRDGRQHRSTSPRQVTNRRRQSESNAVLNTSTEEAAKFGIPVHNVQASTPTNFQTSRSPIPLSQQIVQFPPSGIVTAVEAGIPQSSNQLSDVPQNDTKKVYVNQPPSNSVPQNHLYHNIDGILSPPDSPPDISSGAYYQNIPLLESVHDSRKELTVENRHEDGSTPAIHTHAEVKEDNSIVTVVDTMSTMSINPLTNIQDRSLRMEGTTIRVNDQDILDEVQIGEGIYNGIMKDRTREPTKKQVPHDPNLVCPVCNKQHRLGEIQKFRIHVKNCTDRDCELIHDLV